MQHDGLVQRRSLWLRLSFEKWSSCTFRHFPVSDAWLKPEELVLVDELLTWMAAAMSMKMVWPVSRMSAAAMQCHFPEPTEL
jgi:hypothetical protein